MIFEAVVAETKSALVMFSKHLRSLHNIPSNMLYIINFNLYCFNLFHITSNSIIKMWTNMWTMVEYASRCDC